MFSERFNSEEAKPTPIFDALLCANMVRLTMSELENRNTNIRTFRLAQEPCCFAVTMQLSHIYEAFSDFRLACPELNRRIAQIREEIEKVNDLKSSENMQYQH